MSDTLTWTSPRRQHPRFARLLLIVIVMFLAAIGYASRWRVFLSSLHASDIARQDGFADQDFPLLDRHQVTQLGMAHRPGCRPTSSYTTVERPKAPGVTRIGVFGCSFVQGSEAGPGGDFPSRLRKLFEASGRDDIEIVNFGVGSFGVQQSYLLWQYLASDFDLDVTIYNLYGFHRQRDDTFVMLDTIYAPVHARHVLDGETLRLVEVAGGDRREAAERYFRLRPTWAYLRYDAKAPPPVRALLPSGHDLPNPLYYRRDREAEIAELYARVFADMAAHSRRLLVLANDNTSEGVLEEVAARCDLDAVRTVAERYTWRRQGLFRAPRNHLSALGYEALAREVHALLVGADTVALPEIEVSAGCLEGSANEVPRDLAGFDDVFLSLDGLPAGTFVESVDDRTVAPYSFRSERTRAVLDLSGSRTPCFVAVREPLIEESVQLRFTVGGTPATLEVGELRLVEGGAVGVVDRPWTEHRGPGWTLVGRPGGGAVDLELCTTERVRDLRVDLGNRTLLRGTVGADGGAHPETISWSSALGDLITTRGHPDQDAAAIEAAGGGDWCVTANNRESSSSWCTRRWRLTETVIPVDGLPSPPLPHRP